MTKRFNPRHIPDSNYIIKFINNIRINKNGCWEWIAAKNKDGYGNFCLDGKQISSHIFAMKLTNRHIKGLVVDHVCMNKSCCNPDHLRMVTSRINVVENNSSPAYINANKTHCVYNHPFNKKNTGYKKGKNGNTERYCLECKRERRRKNSK